LHFSANSRRNSLLCGCAAISSSVWRKQHNWIACLLAAPLRMRQSVQPLLNALRLYSRRASAGSPQRRNPPLP